jgi:hypothetical protein
LNHVSHVDVVKAFVRVVSRAGGGVKACRPNINSSCFARHADVMITNEEARVIHSLHCSHVDVVKAFVRVVSLAGGGVEEHAKHRLHVPVISLSQARQNAYRVSECLVANTRGTAECLQSE